jgi:hypothetical protein
MNTDSNAVWNLQSDVGSRTPSCLSRWQTEHTGFVLKQFTNRIHGQFPLFGQFLGRKVILESVSSFYRL